MDISDTPDSDEPKRKKRNVANYAARFEGELDRFGEIVKGGDASLLLIDRERLEIEKQKHNDDVEEREAAQIERAQERAEERAERSADREQAAGIEIEKF